MRALVQFNFLVSGKGQYAPNYETNVRKEGWCQQEAEKIVEEHLTGEAPRKRISEAGLFHGSGGFLRSTPSH